ncbi:alkene reductase [Lichenifustis flavocetrariae]|uniref:Alkene reductase n=1 Tax=Lichenifustis flavocetrariae TaxID=2949735 RepID=A0AA42CRE4_9HYPH|nr:alkene reductase [Lichenifustis flavocetrariae]MCW6512395.1 alkene reductase [Lichenifustis flavocetrariae]
MIRPHLARPARALFEPAQAGAMRLANRIVMAPLTRDRAGPGLVPGPLTVEYYAQRASAGLIVAEATQVSAQAQGYANTPGCYTDEQVAGWRKVTDAIHAKGGTIVVQLWHTGRMSHTSFQPGGQAPVAPSAIRAKAKTFLAGQGFVDVSMPRALDVREIPGIVGDFRHAAACAMKAGFDGVELHGAHGYLLDAFLRDGTNHRTDAYGGSIENRARLLFLVAADCAAAIGADRLGVRISPVSTAGDSHDSDPQPLFDHVVEGLSRLRLAYVHVVEGETEGARDSIAFDYSALRDRFDGVWMVNNGYDRQMAIDAVSSGRADLVSFGRPFITNPDLVARLSANAPLHESMGEALFYGGGAHGYTDYPTLGEELAVVA